MEPLSRSCKAQGGGNPQQGELRGSEVIRLRSKGTLTLVYQRDHAAMSARAAEAWSRPGFLSPPLWEWFIEAVRTHDDGWEEEEQRPFLDENGRPHDFKTVPAAIHIPIWRRCLEKSRGRHPYVTLLVASHGHGLYTHFPHKATPEDQRLSDGFLRELERVESAERKRLGDDEQSAASPGNLERARNLLGFLDGLSLMLLGALPLNGRTGSLCFGDQESSLELEETDNALRIRPWPFSRHTVTLETTAREIEDRRYADVDALAAALAGAPQKRLHWTLSGHQGSY